MTNQLQHMQFNTKCSQHGFPAQIRGLYASYTVYILPTYNECRAEFMQQSLPLVVSGYIHVTTLTLNGNGHITISVSSVRILLAMKLE